MIAYPHVDVSKLFRVQIGLIGIGVSILLTPPIFSSLFAMSALLEIEVVHLWLFSCLLFVCSCFVVMNRSTMKNEVALLFFTLLVLISIELGARLTVVYVFPEKRSYLTKLANRTYPGFAAYQGHPFLQFTGSPSISLIGNRALGNLSPFNNFGFHGPDFNYDKPRNVIRIACLGGSTTGSGYPQVMEKYLNDTKNEDSYRFEAMNFGLG